MLPGNKRQGDKSLRRDLCLLAVSIDNKLAKEVVCTQLKGSIMMRRKVLFNQLPPIRPHDPDVAFPILKGFLARHRIPSQTIYWNVFMWQYYGRLANYHPHLFSELESKPALLELLFYLSPFLLELLRREDTMKNQEAAAMLQCYLASLLPEAAVQDPKFLRSSLDDLREDLRSFMASEVKKINFDSVMLWAISCKNSQWIPGLMLTELARDCRADLPVVIGGITSESEARTLMRIFSYANFAIWGEGETPMLSLIKQLEEKSPSLDAIPRLLYRSGNNILASSSTQEEPYDLLEDVYADYFAALSKLPADTGLPDIRISLNTRRGCSWASCQFCNLHQNLPYRIKAPRVVVSELRHLANHFGVKRVHFADQDFVHRNMKEFLELLDLLVALRRDEGIRIAFSSDVSPLRLDAAILQKMAWAGFDCLLLGFEAMTDGLLKKMNKAHRFAHNIHFLKFADKARIRVVCNILQGIPGETRKDVLESAGNIHFLRFYPPGARGNLWISPMRLNFAAPFEKSMSPREKDQWNMDDVFSVYTYLPEKVKCLGDRFHLGSFIRPLANQDLWDQFTVQMENYRRSRHEYRWFPDGKNMALHELVDGVVVKEFSFEPEHFEVLRLGNDGVKTYEEIYRKIWETFAGMKEKELTDIIHSLQSEYLLYSDEEAQSLISIVDTSIAPAGL
jgi:radical SAM superfamily enzyme YgiQ (UPF0313 family)